MESLPLLCDQPGREAKLFLFQFPHLGSFGENTSNSLLAQFMAPIFFGGGAGQRLQQ